jgi:TonB family protein
VRSGILKDKSDVFKHVFSLAASLAVHAAVIYVLAVHFVSVKIIDFGPRVTGVVIAPPPSGMLRLPGVGGLPGNLPAVDPDFQEFIPRRARAPQAPASTFEEEAEFYSRQPVDPRLTSGFRLDQRAPAKSGQASGASLRLPIAERRGEASGGVTGYIPPRRAGDLRRYLYSGRGGSGGASGGIPSAGGLGRTGYRGRPQVSSSVKSYDLSRWARTVVELVQKKWEVPPAAAPKADETVEISVVILKSGALSAVVIVAPSDDRLFNQSAQDAIEESLPFPPLPEDFPEPSLELFFVFSRQ